jgi:hypothetical protein
MEPGLPGVEHKTHGRIASVGQEKQINHKKTGNNDRNRLKMSDFKKFGAKFGSSPKLKPTGC